MSVILPVFDTPITTYPHTADMASILWNDKKIYPWLMNCFIKLHSWDLENMDYEDFWFLDSPIIQCDRINRKIVRETWGNYLLFLCNMLNEGYYMYFCVNTSAISAYGPSNYPHDLMIYGYDSLKQVFYIADFFQGKRYSRSIAKYSEIERALDYEEDLYKNHWIFHNDFIMIKPNYSEGNSFSIHRVKASLIDYIEAEPSKFFYSRLKLNSPDAITSYVFGKDCYKILYNHLKYSKDTNGGLLEPWRQAFHLMAEHKIVMCERICYMGSQFLNHWDRYYYEFMELSRNQKGCENLYIKYTITKKNEILEKINERIQKVENTEYDILKDMILDIRG